ncbi:MAG TPA: 3D domain-containing protein [Gaiellaceae bacterium]|nr:3D domain-containing protein [Gaiellaceae bacterium]
MLGRMRSRTVRFGGLAAVLTLTAASAALAAPGAANRGATGSAVTLGTEANQALLSLYALDSQLQAWHYRVGSLERQAAALRQQRTALRTELGAARASLEAGQRRLAVELRSLYEQGDVNSLAVVLGAKSLAKGLSKLDDLSRVADQGKQIVAATSAARSRLLRSQSRLAAEELRLEQSLAAAREAEQRVAAAATARRAYVSSLRARERAAQVRSVEAQAQAAQQKSQHLAPATPAPPPPAGKRHLSVSATCYDLPGRTATGMPVGQGVVAVDPSVIPLGTRMYVPGYGSGVAADVGGGIQGATIDLWMTPSQCAAWGRRTVTITIY